MRKYMAIPYKRKEQERPKTTRRIKIPEQNEYNSIESDSGYTEASEDYSETDIPREFNTTDQIRKQEKPSARTTIPTSKTHYPHITTEQPEGNIIQGLNAYGGIK